METCRGLGGSAFAASGRSPQQQGGPQQRLPGPKFSTQISSLYSPARAEGTQSTPCRRSRLAADLSCVRRVAGFARWDPSSAAPIPLPGGGSRALRWATDAEAATLVRSSTPSLLHRGTSSRSTIRGAPCPAVTCRGALSPAVTRHRQSSQGRGRGVGGGRGGEGSGGTGGRGRALVVALAAAAGSIAAAAAAEAAAPAAFASAAGPQLVASEGVPLAFNPPRPQVGPRDFAILSLCFVACAISAAFSVVLMAAVPALLALRRAALAIEQLAITAREELPGTMAAVRLSGMEISDLTMELSDLSQEITEGVRTSTRAVKAAEDGIQRMKGYAQTKTVAMLEERAGVPVEPSPAPPRVAQVARQSKDAITGARSFVSQASMLGGVLRFVPFMGSKHEDKRRTGEKQRVRYS